MGNDDGIKVVKMTGEYKGAEGAKVLQDSVVAELGKGARKIVLNLAKCTAIDLQTIKLLLQSRNSRDFKIILSCIPEHLKPLLSAFGVIGTFEAFDTDEQAENRFRGMLHMSAGAS